MSCKDKWQEDVDILANATNVAAGSANAAPRCLKPDCNRPLRKDGTCVLGHAQSATATADAYPAQIDALRCAFQDLAAEISCARQQRSYRSYVVGEDALSEAQALLAQQPQWAMDPSAAGNTLARLLNLFLTVSSSGDNHPARQDQDTWLADPRIQAAARAAQSLVMDQAEHDLTLGLGGQEERLAPAVPRCSLVALD